MFYYRNWEKLCASLATTGKVACRADESLTQPSGIKYIVLKHDVEANVGKAFRLAEIEHRYGLCGSYYVQAYLLNDARNVDLLEQMQEMGHEISYHYDVLDANNGDYAAAERDFSVWLKRFQDFGFALKTICQHGNPVKQRIGYTSNRDFFRNPAIKAKYSDLVDMVVDYSRYVKAPYKYISDAGYMWKHYTEPETNDINPDAPVISIGGKIDGLIRFIDESDCSIVLSTHPHRWEKSSLRINLKIYMFRALRSTVRTIEKIPLAKSILDKFYFLAKRI